jgi:hypothetical protein
MMQYSPLLKEKQPNFYSPEGLQEFQNFVDNFRAKFLALPLNERKLLKKQTLIDMGVLNSDGSKSINYYTDGV